jgi:hypothetical protein
MFSILSVLAQMDSAKLMNLNDGSPTLTEPPSYGMAWVVAMVLTALILLVTFKTSRRNHTDRE